MEVESCLPTDDVLLKETKKFLAYQEIYSWQENMRLYECNVDHLKVWQDECNSALDNNFWLLDKMVLPAEVVHIYITA